MFDSMNEQNEDVRPKTDPFLFLGTILRLVETSRRSVRGKRPETDPPKVGMTLLEMLAEKLWPKEQGLPLNTTEAMSHIRETATNCENKSLITIDSMKHLDQV